MYDPYLLPAFIKTLMFSTGVSGSGVAVGSRMKPPPGAAFIMAFLQAFNYLRSSSTKRASFKKSHISLSYLAYVSLSYKGKS